MSFVPCSSLHCVAQLLFFFIDLALEGGRRKKKKKREGGGGRKITARGFVETGEVMPKF